VNTDKFAFWGARIGEILLNFFISEAHAELTSCDWKNPRGMGFEVCNLHAGVTNGCATCHSGDRSGIVGKPVGHISTKAACENCHNYDPGVNPAGVPTDPNKGGNVGITFKQNVPPVASYNRQVALKFHAGIKSGCANCHNGQFTYGDGVIKAPNPAEHIRLAGISGLKTACESCHYVANDPSSFDTFSKPPARTVFPTSLTKPPVGNTYPTSPKALPGLIVSQPTGKAMNHDGLTGNCAACHGPNGNAANKLDAQSQIQTWDNANLAAVQFTHISIAGAGPTPDCSACHRDSMKKGNLYQNWVTSNWDHLAQGIVAVSGGEVVVKQTCGSCHGVAGKARGIEQFASHIPVDGTQVSCETCHKATGRTALARALVRSANLSVTNWGGAEMGIAEHQAMGLDGEANGKWTTKCGTCHNGANAKDHDDLYVVRRVSKHISIRATASIDPNAVSTYEVSGNKYISCEVCHIPTAAPPGDKVGRPWVGISNNGWFNGTLTIDMHQSLGYFDNAQKCSDCHDGTKAKGTNQPTPEFKKGYPHLPIGTTDCAACHQATYADSNSPSYGTWRGGIWSHARYVDAPKDNTPCQTCHAGVAAELQQMHPEQPSAAYPAGFPHIPVGKKVACITCHFPTAFANKANPQESDWGPASAMAGKMTRVQHDAMKVSKSNCSQCHDGVKAAGPSGYTDNSGETPVTRDHPDVGKLSCEACHAKTISDAARKWQSPSVTDKSQTPNTADWKDATMKHIGIVDDCQSCHDGSKAKSQTQGGFNHMEIAEPEDCSVCHKASIVRSGLYVSWEGGKWDHIRQKSVDCAVCHGNKPKSGAIESGVQTQSNWVVGGRTLKHVPTSLPLGSDTPTGEEPCSTCHSSTATKQFKAWTGATMGAAEHINMDIRGNCAVCHTNSDLGQVQYDFSTSEKVVFKPRALRPPLAHVPSDDQCERCHTPERTFGTAPRPRANISFGGTAIMPHTPDTLALDSTYWPTKPAFANGNDPLSCVTCHFDGSKLAVDKVDAPTPPGHVPLPPVKKDASGNPTEGFDPTCSICHQADVVGDRSVKFKPSRMNHIGSLIGFYDPIAQEGKNQCISCHGGKFRKVGPTGAHSVDDAKSLTGTAHIPITFGGKVWDCDRCHEVSDAGAWPKTAHAIVNLQTEPCVSCHNRRTPGGSGIATGRPSQNHPENDACEACHSLSYKGQLADGKPGDYPPLKGVTYDYKILPFTTWKGAAISHASLAAAPAKASCGTAGCHDGNRQDASGKPKNHIPNPANAPNTDCAACHLVKALAGPADQIDQNKTWVNTGEVHVGQLAKSVTITTGCVKCHADQFTAAKTGFGTDANMPNAPAFAPPNAPHIPIPANVACETCHQASISGPNKFATWNGGKYHSVYKAAAGTCNSCHNGLQLAGSSYLPNGLTYDGTGYAGTDTHYYSSSDASQPWDMSTSAHTHGQPHIYVGVGSATNSCDLCHKSTTTFTDATPNRTTVVPLPHSSVVLAATGGCVTCHSGAKTFAGALRINQVPTSLAGNNLAAVTGHVPTVQPCEVCHGKTSFASFKIAKTPASATMNHAGISKNCATCHFAKTTAALVTKVAGVVVQTVIGEPSNHIPDPVGTTCETCHSVTNFTSFGGTKLDHAKAGIVDNCELCHKDAGNPPVAPTYAGNQKPFTKTRTGLTNFTHPDSPDTCVTCHAKSIAGGYLSWAGAFWDHKDANGQKITTGCDTCHNGTKATGMDGKNGAFKGKHIPINPSGVTWECESCHQASINRNFDNFTGGHVDHEAAPLSMNKDTTTYCDKCHTAAYVAAPNYAYAKSATAWKSLNAHIPYPNTLSCGKCHQNFVTFTGAVMGEVGHTGINPRQDASPDPNCVQCHDNGTYKGGNPTIGTGMQIKGKAFLPDHDKNYNTSGSNKCNTCHNSFVTFTGAGTDHKAYFEAATPDCDGSCHKPGGNGTATGVMTGHIGWPPTPSTATSVTVNSVPTDCYACHKASIQSAQTDAQGKVIPTSFAGGIVHNASTGLTITSGCVSCHDGAHTSSNAKGKDSAVNHIPVRIGSATSDIACEKCHSNSNFTAFTQISANFHVSTQANLRSNCATCHTGGLFAGQAVKGISADHLPIKLGATTLACERCHNNADANLSNWITDRFTGIKMSTKNHARQSSTTTNDGIVDNCETCHNGLNYAVSQQAKSLASVGKDSPGQNHMPLNATTGTACKSCHAASYSKPNPPFGNNYASWAGGVYHDTAIAATLVKSGCATCHSGSVKGASGKSAGATAHVATTQACELCHTYSINDATGKYNYWYYTTAASSMNHTGITTGCASCHDGQSFAAQTNTGATATIKPTSKTANVSGGTIKHVPTSEPCESCHKPSTFAAGGVWAYSDWTTAKFHTANPGITAGCAACHDGTYTGVSGVPTGNIGTTTVKQHNMDSLTTTQKNCENCHAASVSGGYKVWTGGVTNHTGFTSGCTTCHTGGDWTRANTSVVTTRTPKGTSSVPAGKQHMSLTTKTLTTCESCHGVSMLTTTGTWTSWAGGQYDHKDHSLASPADLSNTCESCHLDDSTVLGATGRVKTTGTANPNKHVDVDRVAVANAQCHVCHKSNSILNVANKYVVWSGAQMAHKGNGSTPPAITSGCQTCHVNATATSPKFQGDPNLGSLPQKAPSSHIPFGTKDCVLCHAASLTSTATTRSDYGSWTGGVYHSVVAWTTSEGRCDSCHSGTKLGPVGKMLSLPTSPKPHIPTNLTNTASVDDCVVCHTAYPTPTANQSQTWRLADLAGGTGATTYKLGYRMVHYGGSSGNPGANALSCSTCHDTSTVFAGYPHPTSSKAGPMKKTDFTGHPSTTNDCSGCHGASIKNTGVYDTWTGGLGGDHSKFTAATTCGGTGCHSATYNATTTGVPNSVDQTHIPLITTTGQQLCGTCHSKALDGKTVPLNGWTNTGIMDHLGSGLTDATVCSICHATGTGLSYSGGKATPLGAGNAATLHTGYLHMTIPSGTNCSVCHTGRFNSAAAVGANDATDWKGSGIYHKSTVGKDLGNCTNCHANGSKVLGYDPAKVASWGFGVQTMDAYVATVNGVANTKIHIPTTAPVQSGCEKCHAGSVTGGYLTWASGAMNHTGIVFKNPGCATCHDGIHAMGFPPKTGKGGTQLHPDHTFKTEGAYASWSTQPGGLGSLPKVDTMACETCHMSSTGTVVDPVKATDWSNSATTNKFNPKNYCRQWHSDSVIKGNMTAGANGTHTGPSTCWYCHYSQNQAATGNPATANTWGARNDTEGDHRTPYLNKSGDCYGSCHEHGNQTDPAACNTSF
jgi:hypothetical protein